MSLERILRKMSKVNPKYLYLKKRNGIIIKYKKLTNYTLLKLVQMCLKSLRKKDVTNTDFMKWIVKNKYYIEVSRGKKDN
jgi:hypothetical protein